MDIVTGWRLERRAEMDGRADVVTVKEGDREEGRRKSLRK